MVPFEAQKSSSKHGIIYSSVFNSLLGKVSLDSVASLSNKNVHKKNRCSSPEANIWKQRETKHSHMK